MLNMSKVELELIPDPDMQIFFENGTRGGVFYISNRYSKGNNKYLKSYNSNRYIYIYIYSKTNNKYLKSYDQKSIRNILYNLCGYTISKFSFNKWIQMNRY